MQCLILTKQESETCCYPKSSWSTETGEILCKNVMDGTMYLDTQQNSFPTT
eukprot:m.962637 g.962637  ORF g.962637 m.962637 type:complete len:51 (-) comp23892_c0_seq12:3664-3816(-)